MQEILFERGTMSIDNDIETSQGDTILFLGKNITCL
jgi:hypothetical protein